ncbi:MAG: carboxypeptidase-like regulatory domain-containing protein [Gemmatimonadales bacterium]
MKRAWLTTLVLSVLPLGLASAQSLVSTGIIDGVVTDTNLVALAGSDVAIIRTTIHIVTGPNGRFRITGVPAGQYLLSVRKVGYDPMVKIVDVAADDTLRLSIFLDQSKNTLNTVVVKGESRSPRMAEFDQRRETGRGQFLTEQQIDKRNTPSATELIRTFTSVNVKMYAGAGGQMQYFAMSNRSNTTDVVKTRRGKVDETVQGCPMQVYIDNVAMPTPFSLDQLPAPRNLAGIELYPGPATVPPQFGGPDRRCGVILVWTKDGG